MKSAGSLIVGAGLGLTLLAGCGGDGGSGPDCDPIAATLVSRIEVQPSTGSVADGEAMQLTAKAFSCDGSQLASPSFTWQSADATTVSVSTSGTAVGVKIGGPVAIKASAQGKEGNAQISVVARAVASVVVEPTAATVALGRTSTLTARAFDAQGRELPGRAAAWSSANDAVVSVSQLGAITGVSLGGPIGVTATIEGHSGTSQVSVTAVAVASVTVTPPEASIEAGSTVQLSALLKDDQGNVLTGRAVLWSTSNATRASVSNTGLVTGVAEGGPVAILATSEGLSGSSQITVTPAPASKVAFLVQPSAVAAGAPIAPPVQVEIQNALGQRITTSSASVTIALGANPGSGSLTGTLTAAAVNGVATFGNLRIDSPGTGYTLTAASSGLAGSTSSTFTVNAGPPVALRFVVQPGNVVAGAAITPAVQVELIDAGGNRATGASALTSLSIGSNPGGATLGGTASVNAVNGLATFDDLNLNAAGTGYTLVAASAGLSPVTSGAFNVMPGAPATLTFIAQPGNTTAGSPISPVQVEVRDGLGNLVTNAATPVSIAIGNNPGGGTLDGNTSVETANGVATFGGLSINLAGAGYTLVASTAGINASSAAFDVSPGPATQLGFAVQPTDIRENDPITPAVTVEVRDAQGNRVTDYGGSVALQLRSETGGGAGGGNQLLGGGARAFVQGLAVFTDLTVNFTGIVVSPRRFTMRTNMSPLPTVSSSAFQVSVF